MNGSDSPRTAHSNLILSGDYGSPTDVLATETLDRNEKVSILEVWLSDIDAFEDSQSGKGDEDVTQLRSSIESALATLKQSTD